MTDELDFSLHLSPLPSKGEVSLSEAMQFLRYGGVPRIRYTGTIPARQIEGGYLSIAEDGHYVLHPLYSDVRLRGPHALDIAKVGGALFGLTKDDRPDPKALESAKARQNLRLTRHNVAKRDFAENTARRADAVELHRQWQVLSVEFAQQFRTWESGGKVGAKPECPEEPAIPNEPMPPTPPAALDTTCLPKAWQAEKERREAALQAHLNYAARSGKLKILGVQIDEPLCLKPSPPPRQPSQISADYFSISRDFDSDYERIHFVDSNDSAATEDNLLASLAGETMHSYSNVCVEREGLLALAAEISPALAHTEQNASETVAAQVATPKKRGPKFKYDWASFDRQLQLVLDHEGAINPKVDPGPKGLTQAQLEDEMTKWCELNWGTSPVESSIRDRVSAFLAKAGN